MWPLWKTVWPFIKKLNRDLQHDLSIPLLANTQKKGKWRQKRVICTPMFTAALFTPKRWKQPKCPMMDGWIEILIDLYDRILFSPKRNEILIQATTWMNLKDTMLTEMSQIQKDKIL